jgi:hypothetical protein
MSEVEEGAPLKRARSATTEDESSDEEDVVVAGKEDGDDEDYVADEVRRRSVCSSCRGASSVDAGVALNLDLLS